MLYPKIMEAILGNHWAMNAEFLTKIVAIVNGEGDMKEAEAIREMRQVEGAFKSGKTPDGTAIIPVFGPLVPRANLMTQYSGATSFSMLQHELEAAMADAGVRQIILNIDSPGGTVTGTEELTSAIREFGKQKRIVAYVSGQAASAAYWVAAACSAIYGGETAMYGSIGTIVSLVDDSKAMEKEGYKRYDIVSAVSPNKRPDITTEAGRKKYQAIVDALADVFVSKVAEYRGVSFDTVVKNFGGGDMFIGQEAVTRGMADGITTLENLLTNGAAMTVKNPAAPSASAPVPPAEGTTATPSTPSAPAAAPAGVDVNSQAFKDAVAAAAAQASAQAIEAERARIAACDSLKSKMPGYEAFIDQKKMEPGMTRDALAVLLIEEQAKKTSKVKAARDEDTQALNALAEAAGTSGDLPDNAEEAEAVALMVQGASQHESRQYSPLAAGDTTGASLKK